ncbi:hypothetical protein GcC1_060037 [Golovinomyces cichoracearum]|uniref:Uncharacterized protein n=1 Tax=Golovinomyces cichoracearum TaxID=62708 RepID=A0A420ITP0_9PEZI|nr:hypothetical protein GcC1_060037 [Golovinomyces cichoracearum]
MDLSLRQQEDSHITQIEVLRFNFFNQVYDVKNNRPTVKRLRELELFDCPEILGQTADSMLFESGKRVICQM